MIPLPKEPQDIDVTSSHRNFDGENYRILESFCVNRYNQSHAERNCLGWKLVVGVGTQGHLADCLCKISILQRNHLDLLKGFCWILPTDQEVSIQGFDATILPSLGLVVV